MGLWKIIPIWREGIAYKGHRLKKKEMKMLDSQWVRADRFSSFNQNPTHTHKHTEPPILIHKLGAEYSIPSTELET